MAIKHKRLPVKERGFLCPVFKLFNSSPKLLHTFYHLVHVLQSATSVCFHHDPYNSLEAQAPGRAKSESLARIF